MKRIHLSLLLLTIFSLSLAAQEKTNSQEKKETLAEAVTRTTKGDNWFIGAGVSGNVLWGEQDKYANPFERIRAGFEVEFGKWFNPYFGTRIQATYGGLRGFQQMMYVGGEYTRPNDGARQAWPYVFDDYNKYPSGTDTRVKFCGSGFMEAPYPLTSTYGWLSAKNRKGFWQDFNSFTFTIDLLSNFSNLFYGHYSDRLVNLSPIVGLGVITAFDNGLTTPNFYYVTAKVGLNIDFRLTKSLSLYLEPKAYATNNELDGYIGQAMGDATTNLSAGLIWTFNKHYSNIGQLTLDEINKLNDKINENRQRLDDHDKILDRHDKQIQDLYDRLKKCCEEKPVIVVDNQKDKIGLPLYIRFRLDSYKIEESEQKKIEELSKYLNSNRSRVTLVGYADRQTGNPRYNLNLSKKRVDAVSSQLKARGISESRYDKQWKGDREQPFSENEWNRVVIVVEQR